MKAEDFNNQYLTNSTIQTELYTHLGRIEVDHNLGTPAQPFDSTTAALTWLKSTAEKSTPVTTLAGYVSLYHSIKHKPTAEQGGDESQNQLLKEIKGILTVLLSDRNQPKKRLNSYFWPKRAYSEKELNAFIEMARQLELSHADQKPMISHWEKTLIASYESPRNVGEKSDGWSNLSTAVQKLLPQYELTNSKDTILANISKAWKKDDEDWFHTRIGISVGVPLTVGAMSSVFCMVANIPVITGAIYAAVVVGIVLIAVGSVAIHHHKRRQFSNNQHRLLAIAINDNTDESVTGVRVNVTDKAAFSEQGS